MNKLHRKIELVIFGGLFIFGAAYLLNSFHSKTPEASAFTGPASSAGSGSGALAVDASNNLSLGGAVSSSVKFLIQAPDANGSHYVLSLLQQNGTPVLTAANTGAVSIPGLVQSGAAYVSSGQFGSAGVGGNYSFPASLGVGVASPTYKLDVASAGATTARIGTAASDVLVVGGGAGKITAGTYDPVYEINGEKFATFLPGMTGQKEETTGVMKLRQATSDKRQGVEIYEGVLDLASAEKGSDLWLFAQATKVQKDFDALSILLTPAFEGKVWYEKDRVNKRIIVRATADSAEDSLEASYRLTAPRFDSAHWPNRLTDQSSGGIVVPAE